MEMTALDEELRTQLNVWLNLDLKSNKAPTFSSEIGICMGFSVFGGGVVSHHPPSGFKLRRASARPLRVLNGH